MKDRGTMTLWIFNTVYLVLGGLYFLQDLNFEFVIYVAVIVVIMGGVLLTTAYTKFPHWLLWLLSFWGLMHILGGAVHVDGGVLFGYRIYPFLDFGGDFYVLKYDQAVHMYLYGVVALMAHHLLLTTLAVRSHSRLVALFSIMAAVGVSVLNEIMEFIISLNMKNGVGGYENTMLDLIFNLSGAVVAVCLYQCRNWKK